MNCYCSILFFERKKYLVQCCECKKKLQFDSNNSYEFKWYEYPIKIVRDDPWFRLGLNMILIMGGILCIFVAHLDLVKAFDFKNTFIGKILSIILGCYMIILFGHLYVYEQLEKNLKYKLR